MFVFAIRSPGHIVGARTRTKISILFFCKFVVVLLEVLVVFVLCCLLIGNYSLFFFFKSSIYTERIGRPWQHYVKGSYTPPAHVVSVPPRPQL